MTRSVEQPLSFAAIFLIIRPDGEPRVREVYNKSHDLQSDPKLYKMSSKERRAEGEKLYNTLSDAEKEEMKEILIKAAVQMKELNREYQRTREEDHTYLSE
ncbi:hypothetical protein Y032_0446g1609 [Ancylostoma ceylanicum]|nr:hypothetical protein Y032_0446g1609 [Ancylostoma ceylanicum]